MLASSRLTSGRDLVLERAIHPLDTFPLDPDAMDDEFSGSTLDTGKWTWLNQDGRSASLGNGLLTLTDPSSSTGIGGIYQSTPTAPWCFRAKLVNHLGQQQTSVSSFIFAGQSTTQEQLGFGGYAGVIRGSVHATPTSGQTGWTGEIGNSANRPYVAYLQLAFDGTQLIAALSRGGGWYVNVRDAVGYTPAIIGLASVNTGSVDHVSTWDYFRRVY